MRIASPCAPLRKDALPVSRSLPIWAERLGLTGTGGGGTPLGVSRERRERWRRFRAVSSVVRAAEVLLLLLLTALVVGSRWRGRRVNMSASAAMVVAGRSLCYSRAYKDRVMCLFVVSLCFYVFYWYIRRRQIGTCIAYLGT